MQKMTTIPGDMPTPAMGDCHLAQKAWEILDAEESFPLGYTVVGVGGDRLLVTVSTPPSPRVEDGLAAWTGHHR